MSGILRNALLRLRFGPPVVVVSGLPRSGTSMMMKMLEAGGLSVVTDAIREADEDNPKGYYELEQVKDLDKPGDKSWMRAHRGKVVKVISALLPDLPDDNAYRIIFMRRDYGEIIASQNKMLDRRGEQRGAEDEKMIATYEAHLKKIRFLIDGEDHYRSLDVGYRDALERPREAAEQIARFLGRRLDIEKMVSVVDRSLYRNRAS